jgi:hypothetical protein
MKRIITALILTAVLTTSAYAVDAIPLHQNYISDVRADVQLIWDALQRLKARQVIWNALDFGATLQDGQGQNAGITKTEVGAACFATTDALAAVLFGSGHSTNFAKVLNK